MKPYYVYSPPFDRSSGGIVVMHKIAKDLSSKGCEVHLKDVVLDKLYQTDWPNMAHGIAIYPEIVHRNPFGCKTVVRILLSIPGMWGGPTDFSPYDLLYVYSKMFNSKIHMPENRILYVPCLDLNVFYDQGKSRSWVGYYRGKGTQPDLHEISHASPLGGKESFRGEARQAALCDLLNRCRLLYVYDYCTCITDIARLCGCPVVVIPNDIFSKADYEQSEFWEFGGIGYGLEEADLAINSMDSQHARDWYLMKEEEFQVALDRFIEVTQDADNVI